MRRLLVVVNRSAGTADDEAVAAAVAELRRDADVTVAATGDEDDLDEAVAARGDRGVVVVGGDGSVHAVVRALDRAGALDPADPLGIVPLGTGNDLARALGLPLDPVEAAALVRTGVRRPLDLLRDDARGLVVNAVHAGVGTRAYAAAARVKPVLKRASFPVGAVFAGMTTTGWALRVEVDGRAVGTGAGRVLMAAVCNGPTIGGGRPLAPDARLDDGLADVVLCAATGPVARAAFALALLSGRHTARDDVLVVSGREITIAGEPVALDADGELGDPVPSRTWRVHRSAWAAITPR
ncbi:diacylglycerol/lipid kinase family protein [Geodermatophilus sp. SYSU D01186]